MIYEDLEFAKNDLRWFLSNLTTISDVTNSFSEKKIDMIVENLNTTKYEFLRPFYKELFYSLGFERLEFEKTISKQFLPVLAFIPNIGLSLIYECNDKTYKAQTRNGVEYFNKFPIGSVFAKLIKQEVESKKVTAYAMFKKVALEQKRMLAYAAIATFSINILALGTSLYSMQVYDRVVPTGATSTLIALTIGVFIAIFLEMLIKFSRSTISDYALKKMDIEYSNDIFERFLQIRCDALPKSIGTLSGQLQSYSNVRAFITSAAMFGLIDLPFSIIFIFAILIIGGFQMALIPVFFLIISIISGFLFKNKIERASQSSSMASYRKIGLMVETLENSENIKASGAGFNLLNVWNKLTHDSIDDDIEIRHYSDKSNYLSAFLQQISYIAIISYGAYLVSENGAITMGALIAMSILSGRILQPIAQLPSHFVQWGKAKLSVKDLNNVFSLPCDNEGVDRPLSPYLDNVDIKCDNIKFGYMKDSIALNIPMLNIKQGEKIAILGPIGSGKTTLLKILAGLYKPMEGSAYLNNIDMQYIKRDLLTDTICYLPQNTKLFTGTLRENLVFGMIGVSDEDIINACKLTGLINLINALPNGLDTFVPEGGESVSGGQKQLIALTKMFIANKKIILLDEPTASMDEGLEKQIIEMFRNKISSEQTMVVVTHKPIVLNMVDRIIIFGQKGIIMDGQKEEVLKKIIQTQNMMKGS